jgi:hypothetical protein
VTRGRGWALTSAATLALAGCGGRGARPVGIDDVRATSVAARKNATM